MIQVGREREERPSVQLSTQTWTDISGAKTATSVLQRLAREGSDFEFDRMGHEEPTRRPFDPKRAIDMWTANFSTLPDLTCGQLILQKRNSPHTGLKMNWQTSPPGKWLNSVSVWLDDSHLEDPALVERFLVLFADISQIVEAGYGFASHLHEWSHKYEMTIVSPSGVPARTTVALKPQDGLIDLYWANLFGPPYARLLGGERILSCPKAQPRRLGPETYLLMTCDFPFEWGRPEILQSVESMKDYLGRDFFFDKDHPERRLRAPQWKHVA